jgi:hypothetical protein
MDFNAELDLIGKKLEHIAPLHHTNVTRLAGPMESF